jgi:hypothetical protein
MMFDTVVSVIFIAIPVLMLVALVMVNRIIAEVKLESTLLAEKKSLVLILIFFGMSYMVTGVYALCFHGQLPNFTTRH